jgi:Na+/H+ antiporter NhaD/arsenite permease-like protein
MNLVAAAVFAAVFVGIVARQLLGRGPPIWSILVVGGCAMVVTGALGVALAESALVTALPVLVFLLELFVFASALERAGALDHVARWLVARATDARGLPVVLFVGFGLASAFLVNDALVVIGVPVLLAVSRRSDVGPKPLLLTLAFSVTVGSVLTPFGNPQNLLVSIDSGMRFPVETFLRYLLLPTVVNLGIGAAYLRWRFRGELGSRGRPAQPAEPAVPLLPASGWRERLARHPVLLLFPVTIVVLITLDVTAAAVRGPEVPIWMTAGVGASALLLLSPGRERIVARVNVSILLLFAGLFVVVGGAVHGGLIGAAERFAPLPGPTHAVAGLAVVTGTSVVGSQLVSNVPWVAIQIPAMAAAGYGAATPVAWVALAAASTLAGNVSLLGAASNLIVVDLAEREGVRIGLREFVAAGLPLAAMTIAVTLGLLLVGL